MNGEDLNALDRIKDPANYVAQEVFIAFVSRIVVNALVSNLIKVSSINLEAIQREFKLNRKNLRSFFEAPTIEVSCIIEECIGHKSTSGLCDQNNENCKRIKEFENDMSTHILNSYDVQRMDAKGKYIIRKLFEAYNANPQQLSNSTIENYLHDVGIMSIREIQEKRSESGIGAIRKRFAQFKSSCLPENTNYQIRLMRAICDYIAGMTDQFAKAEYEKLYG